MFVGPYDFPPHLYDPIVDLLRGIAQHCSGTWEPVPGVRLPAELRQRVDSLLGAIKDEPHVVYAEDPYDEL